MDNNLPKTIWFLWLQGLTEAPLVVKQCYESWLKHNSDWKIIFLDEHNIADHVSLPQHKVTNQAYSDILRINLLAKFGGVWVDATCFCTKPLNEWLYDNMASGFFAFERPGPDRMISSWFIACDKYNFIANAYQKVVNAYWDASPKMVYIEDSRWRFMNKYLQKQGTEVWFSAFVSKVLRVHPYFWFHYLFEHVYLKDANFKELWDTSPKISSDIPHKLQFAGLFKPLSDEVKAEIDHKTAPLYKLTWKYDTAKSLEKTNIDYLFKS